MLALLLAALLVALPGCASRSAEEQQLTPEERFARLRLRMVEDQLASRDISDRRVLEAMKRVPRHRFMPESVQLYAYEDHPVPIGAGQTISQPYIVALMTQTARPGAKDRALEIGTGSGYQAAVLGELVEEVFTIEIVRPLGERAAGRLAELGYENVHTRLGDGYQGWPEEAPFDIILVTAAAPEVPPPLTEQLAEGGRLVMPVGQVGGIQRLMLLIKKQGKIEESFITSVRFVPLTGKALRPEP